MFFAARSYGLYTVGRAGDTWVKFKFDFLIRI